MPQPVTSRFFGFGHAALGGADYLFDPEAGGFLVDAGRSVVVDSTASDELIQLMLLGPVMAILLQQRGFLVLHGSAVALDGRAAVFLGESGAGKSTIAAALTRVGADLVADDVVALCPGTRTTLAPSGGPLKVTRDTLQHLGLDAESLPSIGATAGKRFYTPQAPGGPVDAVVVYLLGDSGAPASIPVDPGRAVRELVLHSYCAQLLRADGVAAHFQQCTRVAATLPVRRLTRTDDLDDLDRAVATVVDDLARV